MLYVKLRSIGWCDVHVKGRDIVDEFDEIAVTLAVEKKHGDDIIIIVGTTMNDPSPEDLEAMAFALRLGVDGILYPWQLAVFADVLATLDNPNDGGNLCQT